MIFVSLRFIPLIVDEASTIHMSLVSRGYVFGRGPIGKIRSMVPVVIPLMTNSIRRAESLALAIESRGYRRGARRTSLKEYELKGLDWTFMAFAAVSFSLIVAAESLL
jgi:energy-coupling factor transport system permease protein